MDAHGQLGDRLKRSHLELLPWQVQVLREQEAHNGKHRDSPVLKFRDCRKKEERNVHGQREPQARGKKVSPLRSQTCRGLLASNMYSCSQEIHVRGRWKVFEPSIVKPGD